MPEETQWDGIENTIEDPEEIRVIFAALDSYLSVTTALPHLLAPVPYSICYQG